MNFPSATKVVLSLNLNSFAIRIMDSPIDATGLLDIMDEGDGSREQKILLKFP